MKDRQIRIVAAVVALVYIGIQSFQWYVFGQFPTPASPREELLQGYHPLHVVRSWLMLLAMFGLLFLYYVVCSIAARINHAWGRFAFPGFFIFLILEMILRSIELFYIQQHLPILALKSNGEDLQRIIDQFQTFQSIQQALYFPLIFSGFISYVILFFLFGGGQRVNRIIRFVMGVNILRVVWRLLSDYGHVSWLQGNLYDRIYLPLVVLVFGSMAFWLIRYKEEG
ncbi:MAG: hypothetical protein J7621_03000 [Niastella sp.]|nr:hypothetical protein [Niastella sp.]